MILIRRMIRLEVIKVIDRTVEVFVIVVEVSGKASENSFLRRGNLVALSLADNEPVGVHDFAV